MVVLVWIGIAHAAPPDSRVALLPIGNGSGGAIERLAHNGSGSLVVGRSRANLNGWLLDVDRWTSATFSDCEASGVAPIELENGDTEVWMSCLDGRLLGSLWDGNTLSPINDEETGARIEFELDDGLSGVWWDDNSLLLYAVFAPEEGVARAHVVDPFALLSNTELLAGFPADLAFANFNEALINQGTLFVSHEGRNLSTLVLGVPNVTGQPPRITSNVDCNDIAPNPFGGLYCVDDVGQVADYDPLVDRFLVLSLGVLDSPRAVVAHPDVEDGWLAVTGGNVIVWEMSPTGVIYSDEPFFEGPPDADNPVVDMVAHDRSHVRWR